MKSIIFILVFSFFIFLGYLDHSKYDIVYNPLAYPSLQLEKNKNEQDSSSENNDQNQSQNEQEKSKQDENQNGIDSDYDFDKHEIDEQLIDTDSENQSSENVYVH